MSHQLSLMQAQGDTEGVAILRDLWPLLLWDTEGSAGAPADHSRKPGMKLQRSLFKAQMKCKNQRGPREKMN